MPTRLYVAKGGKLKIAAVGGGAEIRDFPTGTAFIRFAETHSDEAVDGGGVHPRRAEALSLLGG